jgi:hypothetical protein
MDQGQMVRKNSREQVGNASHSLIPGSNHSGSLDVKSRHDSGMHGSNPCSNYTAKSTHGSQGPMIVHGQIVRNIVVNRLEMYHFLYGLIVIILAILTSSQHTHCGLHD